MATAERHIERSVTAEAYCRRTAYVSACCRPPSVPRTDAWRCGCCAPCLVAHHWLNVERLHAAVPCARIARGRSQKRYNLVDHVDLSVRTDDRYRVAKVTLSKIKCVYIIYISIMHYRMNISYRLGRTLAEPPDAIPCHRPHQRTFTRTWTHHAEGDTEGIGGLHTTRTGVRQPVTRRRRHDPAHRPRTVAIVYRWTELKRNGSSSNSSANTLASHCALALCSSLSYATWPLSSKSGGGDSVWIARKNTLPLPLWQSALGFGSSDAVFD